MRQSRNRLDWVLLSVASASLLVLPVGALPEQPVTIISSIEWPFIGVIVAFGSLGSIARLLHVVSPTIPLHRAHLGEFLGGVVAAVVTGMLLADVEWFRTAPRALIGATGVAGWLGTSLLDKLGARAMQRIGGGGTDAAL